ncbi:GreA/GreB family elongation factor [Dyadobacter fermentans]|uniref:GreA/GreB family elongation factor n=1 Tax=Dyadobacter fermentans (strain ATCC 700827 / DSM 18053 / CIP 107007 / KCTC 52180 / NS114) TaxID=471854 RepID=C6VSR5_DYAFD|nr:GreA/GreB family elongation factor [Dyadobacter fermentans]ACT92887.1 GreA/GreB family elongation factor [Dyadobacter fermentans DSM 18053]
MNNTLNPVILGKDDFKLLKQFAQTFPDNNSSETMSLAYELNRAVVVEDNELPAGSIRLNSYVKVRETTTNKEMAFSIVMPKDADIAKQRISILTPMGAALIGLCKGETVEWKMPAGIRRFKILDVWYDQEQKNS